MSRGMEKAWEEYTVPPSPCMAEERGGQSTVGQIHPEACSGIY